MRLRNFVAAGCLTAMTLLTVCRADEADPTELDPQWLEATRAEPVAKASRGIRAEESAGYFAILNHVRQLSEPALRDAAKRFENERRAIVRSDPAMRFYFGRDAAEFPTFVDLHRSPAEYHGKPVTVRGHLRRLIRIPSGSNSFGFEELHEAWLYTDDSQQNPVVIVCSEIPAGLPVGGDVLVDFVSATGYFFKRYGYADQVGEWRFAPLILAKQLEWSPRPPSTPRISSSSWWWLVIGGGAVLLVGVWRSMRRGTARPQPDTSEPIQLPEA